MALGTGLPESPAWRARQLAAIAERPGPHYLLLSAARNDRDGTRLRKLALAQSLGLTGDAAGCDKLERLMKHVRLCRTAPPAQRRLHFDLLPQHRWTRRRRTAPPSRKRRSGCSTTACSWMPQAAPRTGRRSAPSRVLPVVPRRHEGPHASAR
jgi:hypothetical protein